MLASHRFASGAAALLLLSLCASGSDPDSKLKFLIDQIRHERAKLRSGYVEVTGEFKSVSKHGTIEGPLSLSYKFVGKDLVRLDAAYPGQVMDRTSFRSDPKDPSILTGRTVPGTRRDKIVVKNGETTVWNQDMAYSAISYVKDFPVNAQLYHFDIYTIGLCDKIGINRRKTLDQCLADITVVSNVRLEESGPLWIVNSRSTVQSDDQNFTAYQWEFDTKAGFTPRRYQIDNVSKGKRYPHQLLSTTWQERDGCQVPLTYVFKFGQEGSDNFEQTSYKFNWKSVNQPLPESDFDFASFGLPDTIGLLDGRSADSSWIRQPADWTSAASDGSQSDPQSGLVTRSPFGFWRLSAVSVVLVAILTVLVVRIWRRRHPTADNTFGGRSIS